MGPSSLVVGRRKSKLDHTIRQGVWPTPTPRLARRRMRLLNGVIELNSLEASRRLGEALLALVAALPMVMVGLRRPPRAGQAKALGSSALFFLATTLATRTRWILEIDQPEWLHWNWSGKLACLVVVGLWLVALPTGTLRRSGVFRRPSRSSAGPVVGFVIVSALLGWSAGVAPRAEVGAESLAYQAMMPSLAEEPVFRGVLPALLGSALGGRWKVAGVRLGWAWLVSALLFGAAHGIDWSSRDGLAFQGVAFVVTGLVGLGFGWLAARSGSVWPCVVCHSLINSTGLAVAMVSR